MSDIDHKATLEKVKRLRKKVCFCTSTLCPCDKCNQFIDDFNDISDLCEQLWEENRVMYEALESFASGDNDLTINNEPEGGTYDDYMSWGSSLTEGAIAKRSKKALSQVSTYPKPE